MSPLKKEIKLFLMIKTQWSPGNKCCQNPRKPETRPPEKLIAHTPSKTESGHLGGLGLTPNSAARLLIMLCSQQIKTILPSYWGADIISFTMRVTSFFEKV